jgi:hypothetical protein
MRVSATPHSAARCASAVPGHAARGGRGCWVVELLLDDSGLSGAGEAAGVARERYTP